MKAEIQQYKQDTSVTMRIVAFMVLCAVLTARAVKWTVNTIANLFSASEEDVQKKHYYPMYTKAIDGKIDKAIEDVRRGWAVSKAAYRYERDKE